MSCSPLVFKLLQTRLTFLVPIFLGEYAVAPIGYPRQLAVDACVLLKLDARLCRAPVAVRAGQYVGAAGR